jgi:hypothetical protein
MKAWGIKQIACSQTVLLRFALKLLQGHETEYLILCWIYTGVHGGTVG